MWPCYNRKLRGGEGGFTLKEKKNWKQRLQQVSTKSSSEYLINLMNYAVLISQEEIDKTTINAPQILTDIYCCTQYQKKITF